MIKRIRSFLKKYLHFRIIEVPIVVIFLALLGSIYYSISNFPSEKNNYLAQEISLLSKKSETGSVPLYFDQKPDVNPESSSISRLISDFNSYNAKTAGAKEYRQLVCANLNDKEVEVDALEDNRPAVIMTGWSSFYYDKTIEDNVFMSDLMVEGLGVERVSTHYFCYITTKQADYIIDQNPNFKTYADLINQEIEMKITFDGKTEVKNFAIRDIIKSDVGIDSRYNKLFGSYIVCYYVPFIKTTKFQMLYDLSRDENRNSTLLNELKKDYSPDMYDVEFLYGIDVKRAETIKTELLKKQDTNNNSPLLALLLIIPVLIFAFNVFFVCESHKEINLSLALLLFIAFVTEYTLLYFLVEANILFAIKLFSSIGILCNFSFLIFALLIIAISAFVKENPKFSRKYVNEKHDK